LTIYNSIGQQVAQLLSNADHGPGKYRVTWDAKNQFGGNLATGVYIYKLKAVTKAGEVRSFTKKMLLLK
jgi:flagellar hook assembly protein FlgD